MVKDWESTFQSWAQPPGKTEQEKCDNAERAIRKAISKSSTLAAHNIEVFPQGSYRNRTNVRADSDVDICVRCMDIFFYDLPERITKEEANIVDASYTYREFKNDVEAALRSHFGDEAVTRGNKAFDIHENTYRVDADVVACFEHRRYYRRWNNAITYHSGTELRPDNGGRIINWPHQNYENGVAKNDATNRRFKALVRILKSLRNEMEDNGITAAYPLPGYLIECLAWNVPNDGFGHDSYTADVRWALIHLFNNTRTDDDCNEWCEVNELKYLFRTSQPWTRQQANTFLGAAWTFIGFE